MTHRACSNCGAPVDHAEVKERVARFAEADRLRSVRALEAFVNEKGKQVKLPDGEPLAFDDLGSENLRHFVLATVLVLAEQEMRLRDLESFLERFQETLDRFKAKAEEILKAAKIGDPN